MIDSKNIFAERNDKNASKPVARHFNLPNHFKQYMGICSLSLHPGSSESCKTLEQKNLSFKSALLVPTVSKSALHSTNLFSFSRHHTPTIASHHFLHINPHTSHNSFNRSDEGLTFETSALNSKLFTVANLRYQLSR